MTDTVNGIRWNIVNVVSVTDGDTLRAIRTRVVDVDGKLFQVTDAAAKGVPIRLTWLDTPERGEVGWGDARLDLTSWVAAHSGQMVVVIYGDAGWGRMLGDIQSINGESVSQWMLQRGWLPFTG